MFDEYNPKRIQTDNFQICRLQFLKKKEYLMNTFFISMIIEQSGFPNAIFGDLFYKKQAYLAQKLHLNIIAEIY